MFSIMRPEISRSRRASQNCSRREERWIGAGAVSDIPKLPKDDPSSPHRSDGSQHAPEARTRGDFGYADERHETSQALRNT